MMGDLPDFDIEVVEEEYRRQSADDFLLFLRGLIIPSARGPRLFDSIIAPFQVKFFQLLWPSLLAVRDGVMPPRRRFWCERTKKASKDCDIAIALIWLMAFPKRPILGQVCAANQKQAGIIKRRAMDTLYYNPWLQDRVQILQNKLIGYNRVGEVVIEATGSSGASQGDTPDILVLNELVHVDKWSVMETHMNNADGVPQGIVVISTNAGIKGSKAERWKRNAETQKGRWTIAQFKGLAPWLNKDDEADAKRRDPIGSEFLRLWKGVWISGRGGAVDDASIDKCFRLSGALTNPEPGWYYLAGLDLGVSHDHAGVALVGIHRTEQRIKVANIRGFEPIVPNDKSELEVDLVKVENTCEWWSRIFGVRWFGYDPAAGGSFMAQRLRRRGVKMKEMTFANPKNLHRMALAFVQSIKGGKLECYEDEDGRLRRDFGKFSIISRVSTGYKLESVSDEWGHADVGTALVICLPQAMDLLGIDFGLSEDGVVAVEEDVNLTDKELKDMPSELIDIMNEYDVIEKELKYEVRRVDVDTLNGI
jgi:hypothetical protein